ncbi:hypothetical protein [Acaryochloris sp. IP29b_bin.137]|uniref:hypothetical protein n=1 Tax=Acaryochloris sp. IP29b_bin.137 TaxID=2969217 RepID=UPI00260A284C|nr:hypothetical protein [Acaryochloris sp. IP29b_bin.137]
MVAQSSHSYYNTNHNGMRPRDGANSKLALDNLIRRELRVSDPNNAQEVADALLNRYKETPQAIAIDREAEGLPFLLTPSTPAPMMRVETSSDAEMQQAMDDVERDLQELTSNAILKDVTPELEGWAMAIRSMMTEAFNSARYALDSSQRDKTFGIRRTLGDYARLVRLVGALSSPVVNVNYRNLAQSIDEVTAVLLVMMGESLANVSFNRSRYLLQVPFSELQARRDAVIYAFRNFIGTTQQAYGPNDWARGTEAYRQFYRYLDNQGQGDLRSLLTENELSRVMDALVQRVRQGNIEGLRHVGATAQLELPRLRRLVRIGLNQGAASSLNTPVEVNRQEGILAVSPSSPPFEAFLQALELFIDAFEVSGGFRLLRLARPPILFYGLYGTSLREDTPENRLVELAFLRNQLAELLDCFSQCCCEPQCVKCQIVLDKLLYDLDRAIDLYALGTAENHAPEYRAVAYSYIADAILQGISFESFADNSDDLDCLLQQPSAPGLSLTRRIIRVLEMVRDLLVKPIDLRQQQPSTLESIGEMLTYTPQPPALPQKPSPTFQREIENLVSQELQLQGDMESRWQDLVQTMSPSCIPFRSGEDFPKNKDGVFDVIDQVVRNALGRATFANLLQDDPNVEYPIPLKLDPEFNTPQQFEVSLTPPIQVDFPPA